MDFTQEDFERLLMLEHTRKAAEATYAKNPLDADNLTKWGTALVELSQFQNLGESKASIEDAISKLEEALSIDPTKDNTLWALGNAYTSHAFLVPDTNEAKPDFDRAVDCFQKAAEKDPSNDMYQKSLEVSVTAPEFHSEIHKHGHGQEAMTMAAAGGGSSTFPKVKSSKKKKSSDLTYDVCGWIILAVGIVTWVGMAKSNAPPQPLS